jgi:hypothetical protein
LISEIQVQKTTTSNSRETTQALHRGCDDDDQPNNIVNKEQQALRQQQGRVAVERNKLSADDECNGCRVQSDCLLNDNNDQQGLLQHDEDEDSMMSQPLKIESKNDNNTKKRGPEVVLNIQHCDILDDGCFRGSPPLSSPAPAVTTNGAPSSSSTGSSLVHHNGCCSSDEDDGAESIDLLEWMKSKKSSSKKKRTRSSSVLRTSSLPSSPSSSSLLLAHADGARKQNKKPRTYPNQQRRSDEVFPTPSNQDSCSLFNDHNNTSSMMSKPRQLKYDSDEENDEDAQADDQQQENYEFSEFQFTASSLSQGF